MYEEFKAWLSENSILGEFLVELENNKPNITMIQYCLDVEPIGYLTYAFGWNGSAIGDSAWGRLSLRWKEYLKNQPTKMTVSEIEKALDIKNLEIAEEGK